MADLIQTYMIHETFGPVFQAILIGMTFYAIHTLVRRPSFSKSLPWKSTEPLLLLHQTRIPRGRLPLTAQYCRLPPELIFLIVDHAHHSQFSTLSLVCKDIRNHATSKFYDPLHLTPRSVVPWVSSFNSNAAYNQCPIVPPITSLIFTGKPRGAFPLIWHPRSLYNPYFRLNINRPHSISRLAFCADISHLRQVMEGFRPTELSWRVGKEWAQSPPHSLYVPAGGGIFDSVTHLSVSVDIATHISKETDLQALFPNLRFLLVEDFIPLGQLRQLVAIPSLVRCAWAYSHFTSRRMVENVLEHLTHDERPKVKVLDWTSEVSRAEGGEPFQDNHMKWLDGVWRSLEGEV
ncbi:hypothetical protein DL96DRAFT_1610276 [Flagelloscypha sp. PMI_526]|nr:hypothetical protein DL96DRAFT_1610276 [Flagelloscypha sp. PMI_526]